MKKYRSFVSETSGSIYHLTPKYLGFSVRIPNDFTIMILSTCNLESEIQDEHLHQSLLLKKPVYDITKW
jgi:hypothetical protein